MIKFPILPISTKQIGGPLHEFPYNRIRGDSYFDERMSARQPRLDYAYWPLVNKIWSSDPWDTPADRLGDLYGRFRRLLCRGMWSPNILPNRSAIDANKTDTHSGKSLSFLYLGGFYYSKSTILRGIWRNEVPHGFSQTSLALSCCWRRRPVWTWVPPHWLLNISKTTSRNNSTYYLLRLVNQYINRKSSSVMFIYHRSLWHMLLKDIYPVETSRTKLHWFSFYRLSLWRRTIFYHRFRKKAFARKMFHNGGKYPPLERDCFRSGSEGLDLSLDSFSRSISAAVQSIPLTRTTCVYQACSEQFFFINLDSGKKVQNSLGTTSTTSVMEPQLA